MLEKAKREVKRGFSLIELLVVIAVIGILAGILLIGFNSARIKARDADRKSELVQLKTLVDIYMTDNTNAPAGTDINVSAINNDNPVGVFPDYKAGLATGPNGTEDEYKYTASGTDFTLGAKLEIAPSSTPKPCPTAFGATYNYCLGN